MSTITAILEPDADGTLHLPLPEELRRGKVRVTATLDAADSTDQSAESTVNALRKLQELGTFRAIADPVAWQREIREDRPLPGRR